MYSKFSRSINPNTALELVQGIVETAAGAARYDQAIRDNCNCELFGPACSCRYAASCITGKGFVFSPDYHSGENTVTFPAADTLLLIGDAGAGTHTLTINVATGQLTVTHEGRRRSFPGNAQCLLPLLWWQLNKIEDWQLVESQSSRPDWAVVCGFLSGKHGTGPENLEEEEHLQAQAKAAEYAAKCEAADRPVPAGLTADQDGFYIPDPNRGWGLMPFTPPRWTGLEYRRAAANGVQL